MPTPDHLAFLNAQDAQLQRSLAVSPVLESDDRHPHSDADSHVAMTMQPIRSTAHFPTIRRAGQQTRIASPPRRWHRRTTVPQTGQRTSHSARRGTVSYSEMPLGSAHAVNRQYPTPSFRPPQAGQRRQHQILPSQGQQADRQEGVRRKQAQERHSRSEAQAHRRAEARTQAGTRRRGARTAQGTGPLPRLHECRHQRPNPLP